MAKKTPSRRPSRSEQEPIPAVHLLPDDEHPDYVAGSVTDGLDLAGEPTPGPGGPISVPVRVPPRFCLAVSGRYRCVPDVPRPVLPGPAPTPAPVPVVPGPAVPINLLNITVRVDVDRYFPQRRISIEVSRLFPRASAHAIAEVSADRCLGYNHRRIEASITYRDGVASLIPGDQIVFEARRTIGLRYGSYRLTLSGAGTTTRTYNLVFESRYFDPVEFEIDRVSNAGAAVTSYDTASHPTHPADLPGETISVETVYQRAGFDVAMSPNTTVLPTSGTGANGTWSDSEMHNAMVAYWSRFQDRPQWAMWVLFAARHDQGRSLGGVMFDDIGPNHRQGTSIFTDSFIQDVPAGDANPAAWRQRMVFWTAVHEMGHAFNLAHSWQKALGTPQGLPGDPWIPLANQPEARSFMNYPYNVSGGQAAFFADFRFRFTDDELVFMRHAPRRFVQMGNSDWFVNHAFEAPPSLMAAGTWTLNLRPNRDVNNYRFLEPVTLELKLTNASKNRRDIEEHTLTDGRHITIFVQREGNTTRLWRPFVTRCHETRTQSQAPGESIYGAHLVSASTAGWLIDEPGFYKVQAAIDLGGEIVVSNVLRLQVAPPGSSEESRLAQDFFSEDVGRAIAFEGAPALTGAMDVLREVVARCGDNPAVRHCEIALSTPQLRNYKVLEAGEDRARLAILALAAKVGESARAQVAALLKAPDAAAETLGHIGYFATLGRLAEAMDGAGDKKGAVKVLKASIATMKERNILGSVIQAAERKLARRP